MAQPSLKDYRGWKRPIHACTGMAINVLKADEVSHLTLRAASTTHSQSCGRAPLHEGPCWGADCSHPLPPGAPRTLPALTTPACPCSRSAESWQQSTTPVSAGAAKPRAAQGN